MGVLDGLNEAANRAAGGAKSAAAKAKKTYARGRKRRNRKIDKAIQSSGAAKAAAKAARNARKTAAREAKEARKTYNRGRRKRNKAIRDAAPDRAVERYDRASKEGSGTIANAARTAKQGAQRTGREAVSEALGVERDETGDALADVNKKIERELATGATGEIAETVDRGQKRAKESDNPALRGIGVVSDFGETIAEAEARDIGEGVSKTVTGRSLKSGEDEDITGWEAFATAGLPFSAGGKAVAKNIGKVGVKTGGASVKTGAVAGKATKAVAGASGSGAKKVAGASGSGAKKGASKVKSWLQNAGSSDRSIARVTSGGEDSMARAIARGVKRAGSTLKNAAGRGGGFSKPTGAAQITRRGQDAAQSARRQRKWARRSAERARRAENAQARQRALVARQENLARASQNRRRAKAEQFAERQARSDSNALEVSPARGGEAASGSGGEASKSVARDVPDSISTGDGVTLTPAPRIEPSGSSGDGIGTRIRSFFSRSDSGSGGRAADDAADSADDLPDELGNRLDNIGDRLDNVESADDAASGGRPWGTALASAGVGLASALGIGYLFGGGEGGAQQQEEGDGTVPPPGGVPPGGGFGSGDFGSGGFGSGGFGDDGLGGGFGDDGLGGGGGGFGGGAGGGGGFGGGAGGDAPAEPAGLFGTGITLTDLLLYGGGAIAVYVAYKKGYKGENIEIPFVGTEI